MKRPSLLLCAALSSAFTLSLIPAALAAPVYETDQEFIGSGDFNGDGKADVVIVDRYSGRIRIGYRLSEDFFDWANWRASGVKGVTGITIGHLLSGQHDSVALTAADANAMAVVDATSANIQTDPVKIPVGALGPNSITAIDIGGAGNTPLPDLYINSIYNADPTPNRWTLLRNDGKAYQQMAELPAPGASARANRLALKTGGAEYAVTLSSGEKGNFLLAEDLSSGKPVEVLSIPGVPANADYVSGNFRGTPLKEFVFYKPEETELFVSVLEEAGGKFKAGELKTITLDRPVRQLISVDTGKKTQLLAIFGTNEPAELLDFDAVKAPVMLEQLNGATNKVLNAGVALPDAVVLLSSMMPGRAASHYQVYLLKDGKFVQGIYGSLATLADRDDSTVPNIYTNIVAHSPEKAVADMKTYTNVIPGTAVQYQMVALTGGEFTMGTPDNEPNRQKDEGPQHKVKVSPFWMGQFEVTWDQYLLFMYADDERKLREANPTDAGINAVSDAVTRPSKPYVDMSFGMGKSGHPAIAMTHHAASKFCHWLSAKTGHFYRLPTEAEWEYACRAGTTTAYSYGDDAKQLPEYGWYFENSNSKYQRVGKKKANPWGLYDMHGNVLEWTLDQYDPEFYAKCAAQGEVADPWNKATKPYPHSARGGSWDDDPQQLRSGARRGSERAWKATDPQLPKSIWYLSDSTFIGFRVVRPLAVPAAENMTKYWIGGVEKD